MDALRVIYEQAVARSDRLTDEALQAVLNDNEDLALQLHLTNGLDDETVKMMQGERLMGTKYGTIFENGVVVLDLIGPIYPRANMMTMSGATSLQQFTNDFVKAYNDPQVRGIVMNIDSPGGDARGVHDATNLMWSYSKKRKKPVKAFASGYMASASYYIGSVAQEVLGSKGGYIGSIGVVLKAQSLANGQYEITASQSPYKRSDPATDEGRSTIQQFVDEVADVMVGDIAAFRGISIEKLLSDYGQGRVHAGPVAKKQGLIDKISTLEGVVEAVASEAQSGSFRQKRKVSSEVETLLSFTSEEIEDMGLKNLVSKFAASNKIIDGALNGQAQSDTATEESERSVAEGQGTEEGATATALTPEQVQARREELEERFSDAAELFATQMTLGSRILPAEQPYAASDLLVARIDDELYGTKVNFVGADGEVVEGTREEAVRARYEARPKHTMTAKAIVGIRAGAVAGKVLAEEDKEKSKEDEPVSDDRRKKLMGLTEQGRNAMKAQSSK